MIVLDTNVVSELMRHEPTQSVVDFVLAVPSDDLYTTSVTIAEVAFGLARLPDGARRRSLEGQFASVVQDLGERILPFDAACASAYATIASSREAEGRPIHAAAAQIAAICRHHGAVLATRNVRDFDDTGIEVIDPWGPSGE